MRRVSYGREANQQVRNDRTVVVRGLCACNGEAVKGRPASPTIPEDSTGVQTAGTVGVRAGFRMVPVRLPSDAAC